MTVGELRKKLEGVSDDAAVWVTADRDIFRDYGDSIPADETTYNAESKRFVLWT